MKSSPLDTRRPRPVSMTTRFGPTSMRTDPITTSDTSRCCDIRWNPPTLSHPGVRVRAGGRCRGGLRRGGRPVRVLAVRQPHRGNVRGATAPARGGGSLLRDRDRDVGGLHVLGGAAEVGWPDRRRPGTARLDPGDLRRDPRQWGVRTDYVDAHVPEQWAPLATPATVVFFETPSNPMQDLVDVAAVSELAHAAGAVVVLDNAFATPVLQRPLTQGADVVVYSATKHIDGQRRVLGGAILGSREYIRGPVQTLLRNTGPSLTRSTRGCCLRASRRCRCACAPRPPRLCASRRGSRRSQASPACATRSSPRTPSTSSPGPRWTADHGRDVRPRGAGRRGVDRYGVGR